MGAGIASLLWPATQFCIINRPAPGEHLGESIKEIKAINQSFIIFSTKSYSYKIEFSISLNYLYSIFDMCYERTLNLLTQDLYYSY